MTFQKWLDDVNGKFVDVDGYYGAQCTDLMRDYCVRVLGLDAYIIPPTDYAKNIFKKFTGKSSFFKKIVNVWNDLACVPKPGDIIFWDWSFPVTGYAGHTGICTWSDGYHIIVMNQNYGTIKSSQLRKFSYKGVMGWLRPIIK